MTNDIGKALNDLVLGDLARGIRAYLDGRTLDDAPDSDKAETPRRTFWVRGWMAARIACAEKVPPDTPQNRDCG